MLVIRRRPGESILLGADVEIEILDSSASHVKLGIRAPRSVVVLRKEILLVGEQNRAAAALSEALSEAEMSELLSRFNKSSTPGRPGR
jgi:carbon storage regulator